MCVKMIRRVNDEEGIKVCICLRFMCEWIRRRDSESYLSLFAYFKMLHRFLLQKLVNETFQKLWFTPTPNHDKDAMTRKILNITDVVSSRAQS